METVKVISTDSPGARRRAAGHERRAASREILEFLGSVSPRTCVNVMGQYRPSAEAARPDGRRYYAEIARPVTPAELAGVRANALGLGLRLVD